MFETESPDPTGVSAEDQRALSEDNREEHEVMVAQKEEMKQREEKERMEMLEALMGGYQVEEMLESAVKAAVRKKTGGRKKGGGKGTGKPAFPQVGAGSRVAKMEESVLDFFRHSKKGKGRRVKGEGKQERGWMDVEGEEGQGRVDAAELVKMAFGEEGTGAPETTTDDHSMPGASEGGSLEITNPGDDDEDASSRESKANKASKLANPAPRRSTRAKKPPAVRTGATLGGSRGGKK